VVLLAVAASAGACIGLLRPAAGRHSVRARLRACAILGAGVLLQLGALAIDDTFSPVALGLSLTVLAAFAFANRHITGVAVMGVGLLLNLVAVAVNSGMPVRGEAVVRAGIAGEADLGDLRFRGARHLERPSDPLPWLGDVVPVPVTGHVVSFGDLVLMAGLADATAQLARRRRRPSAAVPRHRRAEHLPGSGPGPRHARAAASRPVVRAAAAAHAAPRDLDLRGREPAAEPDLVAASRER
jgi:hypothetical protein